MQTKTVRTHNAYHLGDNLVHLHFLRKVALARPDRQFVHAAQWQYLRQLKDVIADVPNIQLVDFGYMTPPDSIDSWRGSDGFWYSHQWRNDFVKFHMQYWFPFLASRMRVHNPIQTAQDMLFDYPAIQIPIPDLVPFDVLVINSPPGSGQFRQFDAREMGRIIDMLESKGRHIVASGSGSPEPYFTASQIGHLSLHCHTILMVSTGPSWPTFNVWNQDSIKRRIILLDNERVNLSPNTVHCSKIEEAEEILKGDGLL